LTFRASASVGQQSVRCLRQKGLFAGATNDQLAAAANEPNAEVLAEDVASDNKLTLSQVQGLAFGVHVAGDRGFICDTPSHQAINDSFGSCDDISSQPPI
jgi:hypothetical protein